MSASGHAGSLMVSAGAGAVLVVVGVTNGGDGWLATVLGIALIAVVIGLYKVDPPGPRSNGTWRPWRDAERRRSRRG